MSTKPKPTFMTTTGGVIAVFILFVIAVWMAEDDDAISRNEDRANREQTAVFAAQNFTTGRKITITWGRRGALETVHDPGPLFKKSLTVKAGDQLSLRVVNDRLDPGMHCSITVEGRKYDGDVHAREDAPSGDVCEVSLTVKA